MEAPVGEPRIETLPQTTLAGLHVTQSIAHNQTGALWQRFMSQRASIPAVASPYLYSVEVYPDLTFFQQFDPTRSFEKWAAVAVSDTANLPAGMDVLELPEGLYTVFPYRGRPSEAVPVYQHIYGVWIPQSPYALDDRPHFALMGAGYKGEHPDSEEEFWIPIRKHT